MKLNWKYWGCQLLGWGGWTTLNLFVAYQFAYDYYFKPDEKRNIFLFVIGIELLCCIFATHLLRLVLKRLPYLRYSIERILLLFFVSVFACGMIMDYSAKLVSNITGKSLYDYEKKELFTKAQKMETDMNMAGTDYYLMKTLAAGDSTDYKAFTKIKRNTGWYKSNKGEWKYEEQRKGREFWNLVFTFILTSLWLLIYLVWHYVQKNRNDQLDRLRLQATVKELELKTIKSHINPHFIFNALNSIRALVDENPARARTAITELSNILRSSMATEKMETVSLEKELDIVKDYLALEQMRFEERLKVKFDIDEDTLDQQVPPMMIQTLVENAIKHGISKQIYGGAIVIKTDFVNDYFEITIRNTGKLNGDLNNGGFGLQSTQNRLSLLYGSKAKFEINELPSNEVEVKISIPVQL